MRLGPRRRFQEDNFRIADAEFNQHFNETERSIRRFHKVLLPMSIMGVILGFGVAGFLCWAIYRVVTKYTGP